MSSVSRIQLQKCLQNVWNSNSPLKTLLCSSSVNGFGDNQKRWRSAVPKFKALPRAKYGGRSTITVLPGGGIGPELVSYVKEIFNYAGVPVDFEEVPIDPSSDSNEDLDNAITSIRRNGAALKGNIETRSLNPDVISRNVALRNELDLFVNVVHIKSYEGVKARHQNVDLIIVRQNTEGEYSMAEHESVPGIVECIKVVTRENSERLARYAFEYARKLGRKKVTTVHKANIMKASDGLFLAVSRDVAKDYPDIEFNDMIIDNCCMQLASRPHQFDVMLTTNLYGTIVSNVACGLVGGAGLYSGKNYGDHYAIFEPGTRNTGTSLTGKNVANPISMLNASVDLLEHLELHKQAALIREAINKTINEDRIQTADIGGAATSTEVVENVLKYLQANTKAGISF